MKIVLVGFMGTGKSVVGRLLAKRLGWPFFDTDEMVEKQAGASVPVLIRSQGEPAFRAVEKEAVRLVSLSDRCVIATGGGVPLDPENMKELSRDGVVIWLRASPETILHRVKDIGGRPLIDPTDPKTSILNRLSDRLPAYAQAPYAVDTDGLTRDQVADKILTLLAPSLS